MKVTLKVKLGSNVMEVQGEGTEMAVVKNLAFWSALPNKCGKCGKTDIALSYRPTTKGAYYGLKCTACTADFTFHQKKPENGGGFYVTAGDEWTIWKPEGAVNEPPKDSAPVDESDVPF